MRRFVRPFTVASAILVIGGVLTSHAADKTPDPLGLTFISSNAIYWDLDVGIEQGFFKEEGFAPEIISTQSSPQSMQMLIGGSVQVAFSQPDPLISAITKGATELGIIAIPASAPDWFLVGRKGLDKLEDLKGCEAQMRGFPVLARFATEMKDYPSIVYLVSRRWAATDQHGVRFSRALRKAHEWLYDPANKIQAIAILQKYSKLDAEVIAKVYDSYFVNDKLYTRDGAVDLAAMKQTVDVIARHMGIAAGSAPSAERYLIKSADGGLQH